MFKKVLNGLRNVTLAVAGQFVPRINENISISISADSRASRTDVIALKKSLYVYIIVLCFLE